MASRKPKPSHHQAPPAQRNGDAMLEAKANEFLSHYNRKDLAGALPIAQALTREFPEDLFAWKALGTCLMEQGTLAEAIHPLKQALAIDPNDVETQTNLAKTYIKTGKLEAAQDLLTKALSIEYSNYQANIHIADCYAQLGRNELAIKHLNIALEEKPNAVIAQTRKASALVTTRDYDQALQILEPLNWAHPSDTNICCNLANLYGTMGRFTEAETLYRSAISLSPNHHTAFSNYYFTAHYNPAHDIDDLLNIANEWDQRFAPTHRSNRPSVDNSPDRQLRIGLLSSGLRTHPVGQMVTSALNQLQKHYFSLHAYSNTLTQDAITRRIRAKADSWHDVLHLSDHQLAEQIRKDGIDILIDMTGHSSGARLKTITEEPAPLIVKWVGGLFNTMGVKAFDYLISDHIETPAGVDDNYFENLIRLPDDYICYTPPNYAPDVGQLPAEQNDMITFGCFNNPAKLNDTLLIEWAKLLKKLPHSRLFLKGGQYTNAPYCEDIYQTLADEGISRDRVIVEGPAKHKEIIKAYNQVDIALDTWPYSGGLTTCEALLMGVPVVTLPGPTFAGRHSATHLVNAGMPELVTSNWEEYRQRATELASDLESLGTIRQHLRDVLLQSPVCDGPRFAKHFTDAMRAIWQRYCDDKAPAALTFNKEGEARFEDEDAPVEIHYAEASEDDSTFQWQFEGKLIAVDNGGQLLESDVVRQLLQKEALELIAFDPSSRALDTSLKQHEGVHYYPNATLGDGQPGQLHACLDPKLSASMAPLDDEYQPEAIRKSSQVLTRLPLNTIALDSIQGLPSIDWLVLDDLNDASAILDNGTRALKDTLLLQVKVAFQPTHERQPNLAEIQHWACRHGFRFYRLHEPRHHSQIPSRKDLKERQATNLVSADALFIPSKNRLQDLTDSQRVKLAFLLHNAYGIKDLAYSLINQTDQAASEKYLAAQDMVFDAASLPDSKQAATSHDENRREVEAQLQNQNQPLQVMGDNKKESSRITKEVHRDPLDEAPEQLHYDWCIDKQIQVVDIGANPIDGTPPYAGLLEKGAVSLVGFEPQREALKKLEVRKGPHEKYLPYVVGDGEKASLHLCKAPGMTSTLKPNKSVLDHFHGYPVWGTVEQIERVDTKRLDDLEDVGDIDWLKIDIQGGELTVFKNAKKKLSNTLVIQTEVNFIQLYENQPLFAEVDQWMREQGFMLHALLEQRKRLFSPLVINRQVHNGINQLTTADAVYIRDINQLDLLDDDKKKKMALILHASYGSYDLAYRILQDCKNPDMESYVKNIESDISIKIGQGKKIEKNVFVVGCGHTGTTLMASILGAHSSIYTVMRETNWFLSNGNSFSSEYNNEALHAEAQGKTILCEKTPRHLYKIEEMRKKLPQSKFIIMVRDVKDVVFSLKNRSGDFSSSLRRWIDDNRKAMAHLNDEDTLLVYYEDIVASPQETLKKVCSFIGIPFETTMLDFSESNKTWFGVTPKETDGKGERNHLQRRAWQMTQPLQDRRGIWRGELSEEEISIINHETDDIMKGLGYS